MTRRLLGVIGHVDHGKTALVRALTGIETDRLPEEQRRGISIALGFAHFVEAGATIDLIDMPGHERFVRTMVSGATGIGAVLLVVAANEGIQAQTVEHIEIAALLGLRRTVLAVTKRDLVDADRLAAVTRDSLALARSAGLDVAESLAVSALDGGGIAELRAALARLPGADARESGYPWLPVDRAFSIAGHGTVVTGTLRRGTISAGDELVLSPSGESVRVRGLQVHGAKVDTAGIGQRVAVNLRAVSTAETARGVALTRPDALPPAEWLSVRLRAVDSAAAPLRDGARLRFLAGTLEVDASLRLLDRRELAPGDSCLAQLRCAEPVAVPARESFILRSPSPARTLAGGTVLDPEAARLRRRDPALLERLSRLAADTPERLVAAEVTEAGAAGRPLARLARLSGLSPGLAAAAVSPGAGPDVVIARGVAVLRSALDAVAARIPALLAEAPDGVARERLLSALPGASAPVLEEALSRLAASGVLRLAGGLVAPVRVAFERDRADRDREAADALAERVRKAGLSAPDTRDFAADPVLRRLADRLVREGVLIRAADRVQKRELLFHRDAVEAARLLLAPLLAEGAGLLVSDAGAALGVSRKFSVPLLEHFDQVGFTRRVADRRQLARKAG
ncbi:MAG: selenocysteine-specific translation elongation factor [Janthinobacterium lividum]